MKRTNILSHLLTMALVSALFCTVNTVSYAQEIQPSEETQENKASSEAESAPAKEESAQESSTSLKGLWVSDYQWENGNTGAFLACGSTFTSKTQSSITLYVAESEEGPYTASEKLLFSGFTKNVEASDEDHIEIIWDEAKAQIETLLSKSSAAGGIDKISEHWFQTDGSWNFAAIPCACAPKLFYNHDGTRLYMAYGYRAGGIYLLEIDTATGEAVFPGIDYTDEESGNEVDRYYGIHLAGGRHYPIDLVSISYDEESSLYSMELVYRIPKEENSKETENVLLTFHSENAKGPYINQNGRSAADLKIYDELKEQLMKKED